MGMSISGPLPLPAAQTTTKNADRIRLDYNVQTRTRALEMALQAHQARMDGGDPTMILRTARRFARFIAG